MAEESTCDVDGHPSIELSAVLEDTVAGTESTGARWLLPVLVAVVCLAVAGGVLVRDLYQHEQPETTAVELPTPSSLKPSEQPGSPAVKLSPDAALHPYGETVRALLESYTNGINSKNYERWMTSVTRERVLGAPEPQWQHDYRSTRNGSILVHRIESAPDDRLRILFSFTSSQDQRDAPEDLRHNPKATCIHWWLSLPLALENDQWKIAPVPKGTKQLRRVCDA